MIGSDLLEINTGISLVKNSRKQLINGLKLKSSQFAKTVDSKTHKLYHKCPVNTPKKFKFAIKTRINKLTKVYIAEKSTP